MDTEGTLQGTHIDAIGPYYLHISEYSKKDFFFNYLIVISKTFSQEFQSKIHSIVFHYPHCHAKGNIQENVRT
jgi:hypothetical protein